MGGLCAELGTENPRRNEEAALTDVFAARLLAVAAGNVQRDPLARWSPEVSAPGGPGTGDPRPAGRGPGIAERLGGAAGTQPKKTSASWYRSSGTVFSSAVASLSFTRTMSVPLRATMTPKSPSATASTACRPNRVASTRS